ncbi:MAG: sigma-54-dependent Fis family transcriptional regulator [Sphingobacteriia bacterium]|nr:sigma-54-dependent Fis family transcriptional regulator [Sphingobacteriia bacterium]NCC41139.1 sigma-54-dependent Fis family transcriptional regulator [Gammaproteobacteria bacterium]
MSEPLNVLVVEDDPALREAVCFTLDMARIQASGVDGAEAALAALASHAFNLVVSDLRMLPMDGLQLLREIRARHPGLPVLLMTAYGDVDKAVAAMRAGATDFLMKPFEPEVLIERVRRYALVLTAGDQTIAEDPLTRNLLALAARVAETDATVLLSGESGTGKEIFARYIHAHSARATGPFVAINCAAIPENLLEATLFGYEKGAFTGAQSGQPGKFEQAQGGTLLLDEISEMPLDLQAKLLRVLQEREVERVGGRRPIALDIRILATSNRDMQREVAVGRFREDLYYRLNVFPLAIPALRERRADILPLARRILGRRAAELGRPMHCTPAAESMLLDYPWPGNVRELENILHRAMILASGQTLGSDILGLCLPTSASPIQGASARSGLSSVPEPAAVSAQAANSAALADERTASVRDMEREHILATLRELGGSRKKAIERLGISERTLRYKLRQYRQEGYDV